MNQQWRLWFAGFHPWRAVPLLDVGVHTNTFRSKWTTVTAAAAIAATVGGFGLVQAAQGPANLLTAIDPCRLVDTRSTSNVGPLAARLGPAQTATFSATGDNGNCAGIPADEEVVEI